MIKAPGPLQRIDEEEGIKGMFSGFSDGVGDSDIHERDWEVDCWIEKGSFLQGKLDMSSWLT